MRPFDFVDAAAERHPDRMMATGSGYRCSYAEGQRLSRQIAAGLYTLGLGQDDGVSILGGNDPLSLCAILGAWRAGGTWCPVNPRNDAEANAAYVREANSRWLFYHSSYSELAEQLMTAAPGIRRSVCLDGGHGDLDLVGLVGAGAYTVVPDWGEPRGNHGKLVALLPTGGTTGRAKLSRVDVQSWAMMTIFAALHWPQVEHPVNLMFAPITHAAGGMAIMMLAQGATVIMQDGFDPGRVLQTIEDDRVTHLFTPPTAYYVLLDHPDATRRDLSSLRLFLISAAPVSPDRLAQGVGVFGPCMAQCWGQVESPFLLTWLDPNQVTAAAHGEHPERLASCGRPTFASTVAVMDEHGTLLGPGQHGELVARGQLVADGYTGHPDDTAAIRAHGWHHTGDVGYRDEHGFVYIVDRLKDMIISGGFNIFSTEVEMALLALDGIRGCAVIGVPDPHWGEAVKAFVIGDGTSELHEQTLINAVKNRLGGVKAPKSIDIVDQLPYTHNGKIDKKALREPYWRGLQRRVG